MFDQNITLHGKHATFAKALVEKRIFSRLLDVYMAAPMLGFVNNRLSDDDKASDDDARIFLEQLTKERDKCELLYQLVSLLDEEGNPSVQERIDRAFRINDSTPNELVENVNRFNGFVRGGIEILYERFSQCITEFDFVTTMLQITREYQRNAIGQSYEELLSQLLQ